MIYFDKKTCANLLSHLFSVLRGEGRWPGRMAVAPIDECLRDWAGREAHFGRYDQGKTIFADVAVGIPWLFARLRMGMDTLYE